MAVNSKRKGKSGELELARKFRKFGYNARRVRFREGTAGLVQRVGDTLRWAKKQFLPIRGRIQ